jgi:protein SCO1/2
MRPGRVTRPQETGTSLRARAGLLPVLVFVLVLAIGAAGWFFLSHNALSPAGGIGGPFALVDGNGHTVTDRDLRGRYLLVYFGYTYCPDVCPTTLNTITQALDKMGGQADRIQPLFITVDPARDTPEVMRTYTAAFSPRILGLTGTPEQIAKVAGEYRVYYAPHHSQADGNYTVDHSSLIYLMGRDGRFIAPIRADASPTEMAADIAKHMAGAD